MAELQRKPNEPERIDAGDAGQRGTDPTEQRHATQTGTESEPRQGGNRTETTDTETGSARNKPDVERLETDRSVP